MKWLVTLKADIQQSRLREMLQSVGSTLQPDADLIPVDGDVVVEVEGPADFPDRIKNAPEVKDVHPSSELTLY